MTIIIGLTGGIGSGKTTVANLFAKKGIDLIDADIIAREVVKPGSNGLTEIVQRFGHGILQDDGTLNRQTLRQHVFSNPEHKAWLNALLHPKIQQQMHYQAQISSSHYCLWVAPLLIENQLHPFCRRVIVVDVEEDLQIERTCERDNVSSEHVKKILISQSTRRDRLAYADDIIHNNADIQALKIQVDVLHNQYLLLSAQESI